MEAKLAEYRARKEQEKKAEQSVVTKVQKFVQKFWEKKPIASATSSSPDLDDTAYNPSAGRAEKLRERHLNSKESSETELNEDDDASFDGSKPVSLTTLWFLRCLKFVLWLCLWGLFIELEFGAVFFALSLISFLYFNTRTGPKENKLSAYSVFNKNCEQIQGTLTAEKLQREMFRVPGLPA